MQRAATGFVLMGSLLLAACARPAPIGSLGPRIAGTPNQPEVVVTLTAQETSPTAALAFQAAQQDGTPGSFCWSYPSPNPDGTGTTACIDTASTVFRPDAYLDVPAGTVLRIAGDAGEVTGRLASLVDEFTFALVTVQELTFTDGAATFQADPGQYTLELSGSWPQGGAPFYFGIRIT